jgi:GTP-binding protein
VTTTGIQRRTVALIGRQNVGKSTLFNTLCEDRKAIVSPLAGTTRDRTTARVRWRGNEFFITDTGGMEEQPTGELARLIRGQTERAIRDAHVLCLVVDGTRPFTRDDRAIAGRARASGKPVVCAVNKIDSPRDRERIVEDCKRLGCAHYVSLSAKNGVGTGDLLDALLRELPQRSAEEREPEISLAIIGKPNVGKSSLTNRILGEERAIVSPAPHTTRDPQDSLFTAFNRRFRIIDTAGMRRNARRRSGLQRDPRVAIEHHGVLRSLHELRRADVAAVVLDITQPVSKQDRHLFQDVESSGAGVIIVGNKYDLLPRASREKVQVLERAVRAALPFLSWAPLLFVSAQTGTGVSALLRTAVDIADSRLRRLTDRSLERFMKQALQKRKPPRSQSRIVRLLSLTQTGTAPPSFLLTTSARSSLPSSYQNFLTNELRSYYHLVGTTIHLHVTPQRRT